MKRGRTSGGSVTGGSGDVKPQIYTLATGTAGAADDYIVRTFQLPVPRFGSMKTKATVFEILRVDVYNSLSNILDGSGATAWSYLTTSAIRASGDTSDNTTLLEDAGETRTFALAIQQDLLATSGVKNARYPISIDMTDGNGNGFLVATDSLTIVAGASGNGQGASSVMKIYYRLVNIGINEYVGILQSQQLAIRST